MPIGLVVAHVPAASTPLAMLWSADHTGLLAPVPILCVASFHCSSCQDDVRHLTHLQGRLGTARPAAAHEDLAAAGAAGNSAAVDYNSVAARLCACTHTGGLPSCC